jgi:hypothetical protein
MLSDISLPLLLCLGRLYLFWLLLHWRIIRYEHCCLCLFSASTYLVHHFSHLPFSLVSLPERCAHNWPKNCLISFIQSASLFPLIRNLRPFTFTTTSHLLLRGTCWLLYMCWMDFFPCFTLGVVTPCGGWRSLGLANRKYRVFCTPQQRHWEVSYLLRLISLPRYHEQVRKIRKSLLRPLLAVRCVDSHHKCHFFRGITQWSHRG